MCNGGKCVDLNTAYQGVNAKQGLFKCSVYPFSDTSCRNSCVQYIQEKQGVDAFCDKWVCSNTFSQGGDNDCVQKPQTP